MANVLAVVGSRSYATNSLASRKAEEIIEAEIEKGYDVLTSGGASGPDSWGKVVADKLGIDTKIFYPNWNKYGRSAGFKRNKDIIAYSSMVLIFWDGESRGTSHDIDLCKEMGKPYKVYTWVQNEWRLRKA